MLCEGPSLLQCSPSSDLQSVHTLKEAKRQKQLQRNNLMPVGYSHQMTAYQNLMCTQVTI